jgi:glycosyltransferase involved in cell wall biosynthesis
MKVLITMRNLEQVDRLGGVGHYYVALRPHFRAGVTYFAIGSRSRGEKGLRGAWRLCRDLFALQADLTREAGLLIVNPSLSWRCLLRDGISLTLGKMRGKKVVVFYRGWRERLAQRLAGRWRRLFLVVYGRADGMVVLSGRFAETLREIGYRGPIFVESTTVDDALLALGAADGGKREPGVIELLFLARLEQYKGIFETLEAYRRLSETNPGMVALTIAGEGAARASVEKVVREWALPNVRITGYLSGEAKAAAFRKADVYLFLSYSEGMPNSVLEAMAFGVPVVTTAVGGVPDFFEEGKMGFMIRDPDPGEMVSKVQHLMDNPDLRAAMGRRNAAFAREHFLASTVAARLERIFDAVMLEPPEEGQSSHWKTASCGSQAEAVPVNGVARGSADGEASGPERYPVSP